MTTEIATSKEKSNLPKQSSTLCSEPIDDYAKDGGKELFYQDALRSNYESLTIL